MIKRLSLLALPMTTAGYNVDHPFAVAVGKAPKHNITQMSYILCHQPESFDGGDVVPALICGKLNGRLFVRVCKRLNQIIQL